ncbi:g9313 [Coccomyxa elongata]
MHYTHRDSLVGSRNLQHQHGSQQHCLRTFSSHSRRRFRLRHCCERVRAVNSQLQHSIEEIVGKLPISGWQLYAVAASVAAVGSYTAFQILIWDYKNRRTDDPNEEDRSSSYSIKPERGVGQQPGPSKPYNWDTTSYRTKPREAAQPGNRTIAAEAAQSIIQTIREAQEVSKAAEVLLLLGDKGLCDPRTLKMLQALTEARGGVPSAGAPVLKRVVDAMAQDQAVVQIRRCLDAVHATE